MSDEHMSSAWVDWKAQSGAEDAESYRAGYLAAKAEPVTIDREALRRAIQGVLWNASNFPAKVVPHMLGQDVGPLTKRVADAVLAHLAAQPVTNEEEREYRGSVRTGEPGAGHICDSDCHEDQHGIEWHSFEIDEAQPVTGAVEWGIRFPSGYVSQHPNEESARRDQQHLYALGSGPPVALVSRTVSEWIEAN